MIVQGTRYAFLLKPKITRSQSDIFTIFADWTIINFYGYRKSVQNNMAHGRGGCCHFICRSTDFTAPAGTDIPDKEGH